MGDYLSDIAAKSIGTVNVIQPRRAARFETFQSNDAPAAPVETLLLPNKVAGKADSENFESPSLPPARRKKDLSEKRKVSVRRHDSEETENAVVDSLPKVHSTDVTENFLPRSFAQKKDEATHEAVLLRIPPLTIADVTAPLRLASEFSNEVKDSGSLSEQATPLLPAAQPEPPKIKDLKTSPEKDQEDLNVEQQIFVVTKPRVEKADKRTEEAAIINQTVISQTLLPLPSPAQPRTQKPSLFPEQAVKSATMPVINISIGRVEIRAASSSSPATVPKPAAAKSPTLSLEEYLRKRRTGGDR